MQGLVEIRPEPAGRGLDIDAAPLCMDQIRDLALWRPGTPVLSLYVRTDPRDPANTVAVPGWLVELRNSLREVSRDALLLLVQVVHVPLGAGALPLGLGLGLGEQLLGLALLAAATDVEPAWDRMLLLSASRVA